MKRTRNDPLTSVCVIEGCDNLVKKFYCSKKCSNKAAVAKARLKLTSSELENETIRFNNTFILRGAM